MQTHKNLADDRKQAKKQLEIAGVIDKITGAGYYDLEWLLDGDMDELKQYLRSCSLSMIEWMEYTILIDEKALTEKVNLNCSACTQKNKFGCCCGSPCHMSQKNVANYRKYKEQINRRFHEIDPVRYRELLGHQKKALSVTDYTLLELVDEQGFIREYDGRCQLLVRKDGMARCLTHLFALEKGISVYELSPLSCLMFPLELLVFITEDGKYVMLITGALEKEFSKKFGRWGGYREHHLEFQCVDLKNHDQLFEEKDYKPLYKVSKELLVHEFSEQVYKQIEQICKNKEKIQR